MYATAAGCFDRGALCQLAVGGDARMAAAPCATPENRLFCPPSSFIQVHHRPTTRDPPIKAPRHRLCVLALNHISRRVIDRSYQYIETADNRSFAVLSPRPSPCRPLAPASAWSTRISSLASAIPIPYLRRRTPRNFLIFPILVCPADSTRPQASRLVWLGSSRSISRRMPSWVCPLT